MSRNYIATVKQRKVFKKNASPNDAKKNDTHLFGFEDFFGTDSDTSSQIDIPNTTLMTLGFTFEKKPIYDIKNQWQMIELNPQKYSYTVMDESAQKVSSDDFLLKKIKTLHQPSSISQSAGQSSESDSEEAFKQEILNYREIKKEEEKRYFTPFAKYCILCKCFKHDEFNCPQIRSRPTCMNCLSEEHYQRNCDSIACYNCNGRGHLSRYCPKNISEKNFFCQSCLYSSHLKDECGILMNGPERIVQEKTDLQLSICFVCQNQGHFNCNKNNKDEIYKSFQRKKYQK